MAKIALDSDTEQSTERLKCYTNFMTVFWAKTSCGCGLSPYGFAKVSAFFSKNLYPYRCAPNMHPHSSDRWVHRTQSPNKDNIGITFEIVKMVVLLRRVVKFCARLANRFDVPFWLRISRKGGQLVCVTSHPHITKIYIQTAARSNAVAWICYI